MNLCPHAPSGCNYPEGECLGLCEAVSIKPQPAKTVAIFSVSNGRICGVSPREGMSGLANGFYELVLKKDAK